MLNRHRFHAFGKHSIIEYSAKLIEPYLVAVGSHVVISEHAWFNAKDYMGDGKPTLKLGMVPQ